MSAAIAVAGAVAQKAGRGGHTWVFLQYLLGFRRLGYDVLFVDRERNAYLDRVMTEFGIPYAVGGEAIEPVRRSRLFLNVMGFVDGAVLDAAPFAAYLDIGHSASIIASALRDAGSDAELFTIDIDAPSQERARRSLAARGFDDRVTLFNGTAEDFFAAHPDLSPAFVFVDGDHSFEGVRADIRTLRSHVPDGGLILFHDYVDVRNETGEYGVTTAIAGSWIESDCDFAGTFGCCALFRRRERARRRPRTETRQSEAASAPVS
jgi:Methyltransferase domain